MSVFIPTPKKGNAKECSNYRTTALISHASKVMLKILQASKFGKLSSGHRTGKGQFSFQPQRKAMQKNAQTATQLYSSHMLVMLKILQAMLQQYVNRELPNVQAGFRKGRGTRDQIANIRWIMEKAREFQKNIYSALLTTPKPLTVWITINCGKI